MKNSLFLLFALSWSIILGQENKVIRTFQIDKKYLNLPVQMNQDRQEMHFLLQNKSQRKFVIRLSDGAPDYWVFADMSAFQGETLTVSYPHKVSGMELIYQADRWAGQDSVYREKYRPQFHFSSQRGWNNDPNGLVYYDGEYHLFYQHNPHEIHWENMHWGHAVSKDLLHWQELGEALYPDELGTMFSGTATIDVDNTAGFQTGTNPTLIAAYTAHKNLGNGDAIETQCIAYSNDRGRTFTKYKGNPVVDSKAKWNSRNTRDPKIFWHQPTEKWIMVLFERDGHSFYNSDDLKDWKYQSHLSGFWECPELFELPIDDNKYHTKWVIYGASGTYMLGDFDGKTFHVTSGKHQYVQGQLYAAQTFNNIPDSDGRRIQIGWGRGITHGGKMPFGQMMLFPTQLTLRSTRNGVRLFNEPIQEISALHHKSHRWDQLDREKANEKLKGVSGDIFDIKMKVKIVDGTQFQFHLNGHSILKYDMNFNLLNGAFYQNQHADSGGIELEILIDRTSVEIFADHGAFTVVESLPAAKNNRGLEFGPGRALIEIPFLEVYELKSIWK